MSYEAFVASKLATSPTTGLSGPFVLHESLHDFQIDLVSWALRRGRAALFEGTGLGKTRQQVEWARVVYERTGRDVLILAPLSVASQTVREAARIGVTVTLCREAGDVRHGINVTNYDRVERFGAHPWGAVVLDESSCIKHQDTKTFALLCALFRETPFKLCCTATPAPNDWTELGTHAEFLGVCSRVEMLSEYFCHDGGETSVWRLKGHARGAFWRWVSSWGAMVSHPRDLGYEVEGYDLPPLEVIEHTVKTDEGEAAKAGLLFVPEAGSLMERRTARKVSAEKRVAACAAVVEAEPGESWLVWCDLNAESEALTTALNATEVRGAMDADEKEARLTRFSDGEVPVLVTKPSIAGWGLNWQHCARMAFVGVTDSFEAYYQAVRRCWRFGQVRRVKVHIFASEAEGSVVSNLKRKEADAAAMAAALSAETAASVRAEVRGLVRETNAYEASVTMKIPEWLKTEACA